MSGLRVVFMGRCVCLSTPQKLIDRGEDVIAVVTQPDRPKGRGQKTVAPPVKELAEQNDIPVLQPTKVRAPEFIEVMKGMNPDLIVVVAFGQILPKALLDIPKFGCINVHASLLPRYRGAAPLNWCIINGELKRGHNHDGRGQTPAPCSKGRPHRPEGYPGTAQMLVLAPDLRNHMLAADRSSGKQDDSFPASPHAEEEHG
jgi:hypothetical protein